jgi:hypothetical protein
VLGKICLGVCFLATGISPKNNTHQYTFCVTQILGSKMKAIGFGSMSLWR